MDKMHEYAIFKKYANDLNVKIVIKEMPNFFLKMKIHLTSFESVLSGNQKVQVRI